jgi:hypothetical protein
VHANLLKSEGFKFHAIQTKTGCSLFSDFQRFRIKNQEEVTLLGLVSDYRTNGNDYYLNRRQFILHVAERA